MELFTRSFERSPKAPFATSWVGGVATVLLGHARFTADIDIVMELDSPATIKALLALEEIGFAPRAPVRIEEFADAQKASDLDSR